jgi:hypothetical protein
MIERSWGVAVNAVESMPGGRMAVDLPRRAFDAVGKMSPSTRRAAMQASAGLKGVVGVLEWPVAAAVAGVTWIARQGQAPRNGSRSAPAGAVGSAGTASKPAAQRPAKASGSSKTGSGAAKSKRTSRTGQTGTAARRTQPTSGRAQASSRRTPRPAPRRAKTTSRTSTGKGTGASRG